MITVKEIGVLNAMEDLGEEIVDVEGLDEVNFVDVIDDLCDEIQEIIPLGKNSEDLLINEKVTRSGGRAKPRISYNEVSDDEFENDKSDDYVPQEQAKKLIKSSKKNATKPSIIIHDDDAMDCDNEAPAPKKATPQKPKKDITKKKDAKKEPAKKSTPKKMPIPVASTRSSGRVRKTINYSLDSDDEQEESKEESKDEAPLSKRVKAVGKAKPKAGKQNSGKTKRPPISEMMHTAIKILKENPKKGSSLAAIKGVMSKEWGVDLKTLASKIKEYIVSAVADGDLIQTKGKGASGRFTVKGLKVVNRKKSSSKIAKHFDEVDESDYKPEKTRRAQEKEIHDAEMEKQRLERREAQERKMEEKESKPKKPVVRKEFFEVETVKAMKMVEMKTWYQVMFKGEKKPRWEPEDNLDGCRELIDQFLLDEKERLVREEERRRREEEEGRFEVHRILDVKFTKGEKNKKEFLIRWKGHGEEMDSYEPEDNLNCIDLIQKFMRKWETKMEVTPRSLRTEPKRVERIQFTKNKRLGKSNNGCRKTYENMDDEDYVE